MRGKVVQLTLTMEDVISIADFRAAGDRLGLHTMCKNAACRRRKRCVSAASAYRDMECWTLLLPGAQPQEAPIDQQVEEYCAKLAIELQHHAERQRSLEQLARAESDDALAIDSRATSAERSPDAIPDDALPAIRVL